MITIFLFVLAVVFVLISADTEVYGGNGRVYRLIGLFILGMAIGSLIMP